MKLINLNLQCGVNGELTEFIKKHSINTDIFCFQEVLHNASTIRSVLKNARPNLFSELQNILLDFNGHYAAPNRENDVGGLSIFIRKSFTVNSIDNITILSEFPVITDREDEDFFTMGRNVQCIEFSNLEKTYTILNFHGMWIPKSKMDTEKRMEQSKAVRRIFDGSKGARTSLIKNG